MLQNINVSKGIPERVDLSGIFVGIFLGERKDLLLIGGQ
jgi:hypothetical protein